MEMTIDEAIERFKSNSKYERKHGNLQGCLEFAQLVDWLSKYQKIEQILQEQCIIPEGCYPKLKKIKEVVEDEVD